MSKHAPLEFKNACSVDDDDEVKTAIAGLTKTTTDALARITSEVKGLRDRQDKIDLAMNRLPISGKSRNVPSFLGDFSSGDLAAEHKALGAFAKLGDEGEIKAMQVGVDPSGGYVVLPSMSDTMTRRIFDQSPIRRLARVITLDTGDAWQEPIDKDEPDAVWVGETQTRTPTDTPEIGMLTVPLCEIWAQQPITQKLLDTSFVNIGQWIEGKLADKFGRTEGVEFVNGNTPLKPQGFMSLDKSELGDMAARPADALQFVVSGSASTVADADGQADGLKNLYWSLRAPHRANATWLMASSTANALDKLKDSNKDYIWRDSSAAGVPPTLLGRPVEFDENMPAIGAGTYPIAFGDWKSGYVIVDRLGLRFVRDPYSSKPHVLFDAFKRVGGGVANTDAIKLLKIGTS